MTQLFTMPTRNAKSKHTATTIDRFSLVDGMLIRFTDKKTGNLIRGIFVGYHRSLVHGLMAKIKTGEIHFKSPKLYSTTFIEGYNDDNDDHNYDYFSVPVIENVEIERICQYR